MMIKGINSKQTDVNMDEAVFQFLHKEMIKAFSVDLAGNKLFDAEKVGEMSRVKFSKNGIPEDIIVTVKKEVKGRIVNVDMSVKNSTQEELKRAFIEHSQLS